MDDPMSLMPHVRGVAHSAQQKGFCVQRVTIYAQGAKPYTSAQVIGINGFRCRVEGRWRTEDCYYEPCEVFNMHRDVLRAIDVLILVVGRDMPSPTHCIVPAQHLLQWLATRGAVSKELWINPYRLCAWGIELGAYAHAWHLLERHQKPEE